MMMHVRLLGALVIEKDGQQLRKLGSRKSLAMLAYLATRRQAVSRTHLADLLWFDKSEKVGRNNVRWALNNLSKLLPHCFVSQRETIELESNADLSIDIWQFDLLRNKGDFNALASSLDCYQGEFLDGFFLDDCPDFEQWLLQERITRQQQAIQVMEMLISHYSHFNQHYHAQQLITRILEIEPWREDIHRQKMVYLALNGQRTAALKQYDVCYQIIQSEFQVGLEAETTELYEQIRDGQLLPQSHEPNNLSIVATISPQQIQTQWKIPNQSTPFIGRIKDIENIRNLFKDDYRLLTLVGQGGVGKTRLAIELATQLESTFTDGVYFVSLAPLVNVSDIPLAIAETIGYPLMRGVDITQQVLSFFADKNSLLILDNFEHLSSESALLNNLLTRSTTLHILVTSRIRLNLTMEYVYEVRELTLPDDTVELQENSEAVAFFIAHMQRVIPDYTPTSEDQHTIIEICKLTNGIPLALELASTWLSSLTLREIASELSDNIDFLTQKRSDVPAHHHSMRATFEYTWNLLSRIEQEAITKLAIFKGGCNRDAIRAVAEVSLHVIANLIDKSMLRHDAQHGRYTMHELQRQFVTEKMTTLEDVVQLYKNHAHYYLNILYQHHDTLYSGNLPILLQKITTELSNIRKAWDWAIENRDWAVIDRALHPLVRYYQIMSLFQDAEVTLSSTMNSLMIDTNKGVDEQLLLAQLLQEYASILSTLGKCDEAIESAKHLIQIAKRYDQVLLEASGYLNWGKALWHNGDVKSAQHHLQQALELIQTNKSLSGQYLRLDLLRTMGMVMLRLGDYHSAQNYYEEYLEHNREIGDIYGEAQILRNLGAIYRNLGDYETAKSLYVRALQIYQQLNNHHGESVAINGLGDIAFYLHEYTTALEYYDECVNLAKKIGDKRGESIALNNIGTVFDSLGKYEQAQSHFERSIDIKETITFRRGIAWSQTCLALLHHHRDDNETALRFCEIAQQEFHQLGDLLGKSFSMMYLGHISLEVGRIDEAIDYYEHVMSIRQELNQPHLLVEAQAGLARALLRKNSLKGAKRIMETILHFLKNNTLNGTYEPFRIYFSCYEILVKLQDPRSCQLLDTAKQSLLTQADTIQDFELRQSFLSQVNVHHSILNASCG